MDENQINLFLINKSKITKNLLFYITKILFIVFIIILLPFFFLKLTSKDFKKENKKIYLDKYELDVYEKIQAKILSKNCSRMWSNQREFLNGVIRKFRPKKIIELGVAEGGSSTIILNAINDIKNSHLYSIDLSTHFLIGSCVKIIVPNLLDKWNLYKGYTSAKFVELIEAGIDMAFIDTSHFEPGEILDFLIILPFLSKGAIIVIHDIGNQITTSKGKHSRREHAPYLIFNIIRGKKYLPSGKGILTKNIGAIKLERNQEKYVHDYFRALGGQWEYLPKEEDIGMIKQIFKKYYDKDCLTMFEEAISFNKIFVKNNPISKRLRYKFTSKSLSFFKYKNKLKN